MCFTLNCIKNFSQLFTMSDEHVSFFQLHVNAFSRDEAAPYKLLRERVQKFMSFIVLQYKELIVREKD